MRNHQHLIEMGLECLDEVVSDDEGKMMLTSIQKNFRSLSELIEEIVNSNTPS